MTSPVNVLLLEDDANLGFVLQEHLESLGYAVVLKTNGLDGLAVAAESRFDLCLVDVMMPKKDGFTFAKELRARKDETPIIFLTARSLKEDRIEGFRSGGDDYVTKPFSMEELTLRINAVLKRSGAGKKKESDSPSLYMIGSFTLDTTVQTLSRGKRSKRLTTKEMKILTLLAERENQVVERKDILTVGWGENTIYTSRSLDVFISRIRKYLEGDSAVEIMNAHGVGYRLTVKKGKSRERK
jgi:DNA-binding response OmpR family regulator